MMDLKQPRIDVFNSELLEGAHFSKTYEFPVLAQSRFVRERAIPFEKAYKTADHSQWVHFYTHDRHFECVWRNPKQYLAMFKRFEGIITPDFSLYRDMPLAMQIWNTYRNRALTYWLQSNGIWVVPNVRWGDERTYAFAFEGLSQGGAVTVSTNGCIQSKTDRYFFKKGLEAMVEAIAKRNSNRAYRKPHGGFPSQTSHYKGGGVMGGGSGGGFRGTKGSSLKIKANTKREALQELKRLSKEIQILAKRCLRRGLKYYRDFTIEQKTNGNVIIKMEKPGNVSCECGLTFNAS